MRRPVSNLTLLLGLASSLVLHLLVLMPSMVRIMTPPEQREVLFARFDPEHFARESEEEDPEPDLPEEDRVKLGMEDGDPSTMTWIGYDEYLEHLVRLGDMEQAAFTESQAAPTPAPAEPVSVAPEPTPPVETPPTEPTTEAPDPAPPVETPPDEVAEQEQEQEQEVERDDAKTEPPPMLLPEGPDPIMAPASVRSLAEMLAKLAERPMEVPPTEAPTPTPPPTPPPTPTAVPKKPPVVAPPPAPVEPFSGAPSDRESDATSLTEVPIDQLKPGKPLAAAGLELKPRRPKFTTLMQLTSAPRNPLVEIRFPRSGRPSEARIIETSGDARIDDAIVSSLYRWRATGAPLKELEGEETVDVRIRIMMARRR